eukprot:Em0016g1070a
MTSERASTAMCSTIQRGQRNLRSKRTAAGEPRLLAALAPHHLSPHYSRIKMQHQRLQKELQAVATVSLATSGPRLRASRSLPAIGLRNTAKQRPTVFDTLVTRMENTCLDVQPPEASPPASPLKLGLSEELVRKDGALVGGSLNALVEHLLPNESYYPESSFVFAFILCCRLFMKPYELLAKVLRGLQLRKNDPEYPDLAPKYLQLLNEWVDKFAYDFRDERMMVSFKDLTQASATLSLEMRKTVGLLQANLLKKLNNLEKYERTLSQLNIAAMERLIDPRTEVNILRICDNPAVVAQQLTYIELERLNSIGPEEFIQTFVKNTEEKEPLYRDMKKTSNLEAYVEWFNRLSYLTATEICVSDKKRDRTKVLDFIVDVAFECRKLHNFNSCMAIIAGLFMSSVNRLKKARTRAIDEKLQELEHLADPVGNYAIYREELKGATSIAEQSVKSSCVVPFFGLLVKDIYFTQEGNRTRHENGNINMEKCMLLANLVSQVLLWKETVLPFPRVQEVLNYLMTIPALTDDELQLASYELEHPCKR